MAGMTFAEKALAIAAGKESVVAGEVVFVEPHMCLSHDNSAAISKIFKTIGAKEIRFPDRIAIILDHCTPAANEKYAQNHKTIRKFVSEYGIKHFFDLNHGVCHQVLPEKGLALPGAIIVGSDSHTTTAGAFGAFAAGIGRTEAASVWATGKMWLRVPQSIKIEFSGELCGKVSAKDLALKIIGDIGADGALYKSVEFFPSTSYAFSMSERMLLCNMTTEMGAKNGVFMPDNVTDEYLASIPVQYSSSPVITVFPSTS